MGIPLSLHYHGPVTGNGARRLDDILIGEKDGEPKFSLDEESSHLANEHVPGLNDLLVIAGNVPYPGTEISLHRRLEAKVYHLLEQHYNLTKRDLSEGEILFLPSQNPFFGDLDHSLVVGYGQDNWSSAYLLLRGLVRSKGSKYTKIAIFYDKEEIGDQGPGALRQQYIENLVIPMIAGVTKTNLEDQWKLLRNCWSLFCDVNGAMSEYTPDRHDKRLSPYMGSGLVINKTSGDETEWGGYVAHPETLSALRILFEQKEVISQFGITGNRQSKAPGASDSFHPAIAQGIDIGLPILSMHRPTEKTSVVDIWNMFRGISAFYSVKDMGYYFIKKKK